MRRIFSLSTSRQVLSLSRFLIGIISAAAACYPRLARSFVWPVRNQPQPRRKSSGQEGEIIVVLPFRLVCVISTGTIRSFFFNLIFPYFLIYFSLKLRSRRSRYHHHRRTANRSRLLENYRLGVESASLPCLYKQTYVSFLIFKN